MEARDESKHDLKTAYVSPKAQVHYVQGRVVQRGRQRERRESERTEGAGTKLVHCVVDHDDHFVDIMRQLAEPQPQPQPQP